MAGERHCFQVISVSNVQVYFDAVSNLHVRSQGQ
jgi:hypothetical protein